MIKRNLVTQDELDTLAQIDRDCIRMHVCPPPKTFIDMEVRNSGGNLIDGLTMKSNSWVRNAYNYFFHSAAQNTSILIQSWSSTANTAQIASNNGGSLYTNGGSTSTGGIMIGTSDAEENYTDRKLGNLITSGVATGQMSYVAGTATFNDDTVAKKMTAVKTRIFNNNSGAPITIKEVGFGYAEILACRDVLSEVNWKTVPNGGQLTVIYTIEMSYPG
jgi:hypothetical protein